MDRVEQRLSDEQGDETQRSPARLLAGVCILVVVVVLQLLAQYITSRDTGRFLSVLVWFSLELTTLLIGLTLLFRWTRKRRTGWGVFVTLGMLLAAAVGSAWGLIFHAVSHAVPELGLRAFSNHPISLMRVVLYGLASAQTHFGLWTLAFVLPGLLDDARVRALRAEKLEAESEQLRTAAELARLRSHLEPHFLLNTLNAIAGLVTEEPREARRLLSALGDLLRDALRDEQEWQPLAAQIAWLKRYAQILEARHRGDLSFSWEISQAAEHKTLPRLLLQPLVENAIKHGALRAQGVGKVWVTTELSADGSRLLCTVRDNGPGMPDGPVRTGAFGVESVRRRIALRYGEQGHVSFTASPEGTIASVDIPATPPNAADAAAHEHTLNSSHALVDVPTARKPEADAPPVRKLSAKGVS